MRRIISIFFSIFFQFFYEARYETLCMLLCKTLCSAHGIPRGGPEEARRMPGGCMQYYKTPSFVAPWHFGPALHAGSCRQHMQYHVECVLQTLGCEI
jgi:hypothetical protein